MAHFIADAFEVVITTIGVKCLTNPNLGNLGVINSCSNLPEPIRN